ncbi:hypothetical protein R3W88_005891 [Solanum pinnatisectum]|uniref:Zinc finger, CCHC-type n=1 Tax=Solanum pinnatisectum TaxID=50273 RepID=A0AAV9KE24_9SOLN|nr:hypothetical protein R3W88_005891 [Solanum pinnatisectum]
MIFLRHHLDESLKVEYLTMKDPLELWIGLKGRYDHLKAMVLPRARYEWMHLRFQDYKVVIENNSVQYHEKGFKKYSELISCLLVAEQHNDLLMKNHEVRPAGSAPLPEAHGVKAHGQSEIRKNNQDHDNVCRRGGHNKKENNIGSQNNPSKGKGDHCHRCGLKGNKGGASSSNARVESNWTLKDDAQAGSSQKYDENVEANLALNDDAFDGLDDITHLEVEDIFGDRN